MPSGAKTLTEKPQPKTAKQALSDTKGQKSLREALSEYWGDVDRRAKQMGENILLPFYDHIERNARRQSRGHVRPETDKEREWDEMMKKFRERRAKEK